MKNRLLIQATKYILLGLVPLLLFTLPVTILAQEADVPSADSEEVDPEEALEVIEDQRAVLQRDLNEMQHAENLALNELEQIDQELSRISTRLEDTTNNLQRKQNQIDNLRASNSRAINDLETAQDLFEARLVEWYKSGTPSMLGSLINAGDLSDLFHVMLYMEAIIESDQETIDFIREQQGIIYEQTSQLEHEIAECEQLVTEMRESEEHYQQLRETRYSRVTEIASDVALVEASMQELEAASYEFTMLLRASRYNAAGELGTFIRPIDGNINSPFGYRRHPIFGDMRMHTGVDIPAPYGTLIHAAQSGLVVFSGWKRGYGNTVILDHGGGLATLYAHCSSLTVSVGETVDRSQVIARIGSTGYSTGNHLHFEVRVNGEPVDPEEYI